MRKSIILTFTLLSMAAPLFAQSEKGFEHKNQIKIAPLKLVGMVNPGIEMSYERFHSQRLSVQISGAYLTNLFNLAPFDDFRGYRIGAEEKYFFHIKERSRLYISGSIEYYQSKFKDSANFGYQTPWDGTETDEENYLDYFSIHKKMLSLNFKVGIQIPYKYFIIDLYAGLGIKNKNINHSDRLVPEDDMEHPRHPNVFYYATAEGKYTALNIPLNMRIGYSF